MSKKTAKIPISSKTNKATNTIAKSKKAASIVANNTKKGLTSSVVQKAVAEGVMTMIGNTVSPVGGAVANVVADPLMNVGFDFLAGHVDTDNEKLNQDNQKKHNIEENQIYDYLRENKIYDLQVKLKDANSKFNHSKGMLTKARKEKEIDEAFHDILFCWHSSEIETNRCIDNIRKIDKLKKNLSSTSSPSNEEQEIFLAIKFVSLFKQGYEALSQICKDTGEDTKPYQEEYENALKNISKADFILLANYSKDKNDKIFWKNLLEDKRKIENEPFWDDDFEEVDIDRLQI